MPLALLGILLGLSGYAAYAHAGTKPPSKPTALTPGSWYKLTLAAQSGAGADASALESALPAAGFFPAGGVLASGPSSASVIGHFQGAAPATLTTVGGWNVTSAEPVSAPPQAAQAAMTSPALDSNLTVPQAHAVQIALASEPDPAALAHFSDVMLPDFPAAAALLKTHGVNLTLAASAAPAPAPGHVATSGAPPGAAASLAAAWQKALPADPYAKALADVGFHPDDPGGMFAELVKRAQTNASNYDGHRQYELDPKGEVATIYWAFNGGRWIADMWANASRVPMDAKVRATYRIPAGKSTLDGLKAFYRMPPSVKSYNFRWQKVDTTTSFDPNVGIHAAAAQLGDAGKVMLQVADAAASVAKTVTFTEPLDALVRGITSGKDPMAILQSVGQATLDNAKDIAPYVESVVSVVPGIGPEVAAGLALGAALAEGKDVSDAAIDAAKAAIPGGPLAQAAFSAAVHVGSALAQGKDLGDAALSGIRSALPPGPVTAAFDAASAIAHGQPPAQAILASAAAALGPAATSGPLGAALQKGASALGAITQGRDPGQAVLDQVKSALPPGPAQAAFDVAAKVARGQSPASVALTTLASALPPGPGQDAALSAARVAAATLAGKSLDAAALEEARTHMNPAQQHAFDVGLTLARGQALQKAGFPDLRNLLPGDAAAQSTAFAKVVAAAGGNKQAAQDLLEAGLRSALAPLGPTGAAQARDLVAAVVKDPSLGGLTSTALAKARGVAEPVARAALASITVPKVADHLGHVTVKPGVLDRLCAPRPPLKLSLSALGVTKRVGAPAAAAQALELAKNPAPAAQAKAADLAAAAAATERARLVSHYLSLPALSNSASGKVAA